MTRTWKDNAHEFGALTKQGVDVRLAVLVACSVEKGAGQGARTDFVPIGTKCGAKAFTEEALGTQNPNRVLRHLDAWEKCAAQGLCSPSSDLTPEDAADLDLRVPTQEQFEAVFDASGSGSRPRDAKPEDAAAIIKKRGATAVVGAMTPAQRVEVVRAVAETETGAATVVEAIPDTHLQDVRRHVETRQTEQFHQTVRDAGGNPDVPAEPIGDALGIELSYIAAKIVALAGDAERVMRRAEEDQKPRLRALFEDAAARVTGLAYGTVPETLEGVEL